MAPTKVPSAAKQPTNSRAMNASSGGGRRPHPKPTGTALEPHTYGSIEITRSNGDRMTVQVQSLDDCIRFARFFSGHEDVLEAGSHLAETPATDNADKGKEVLVKTVAASTGSKEGPLEEKSANHYVQHGKIEKRGKKYRGKKTKNATQKPLGGDGEAPKIGAALDRKNAIKAEDSMSEL